MNTVNHSYRRALSNIVPLDTSFANVATFRTRDLHRLLIEKLGPMQLVRFYESQGTDPETTAWHGVMGSGEVVGGELAIRVSLLNADEIVVGAEVTILPNQAARVARRASTKIAGPLFTTRLEKLDVTYSDGGVISAQDVERLIEPHVGKVIRLTFRKSLTGLPNTVAWEALDIDDDLVWGSLVLHAGVRDDQVVSWAEVRLDKPVGPDFRKQASSERDAQLEKIAELGRALIRELHQKPRISTPDLIGALVAIVDEAER